MTPTPYSQHPLPGAVFTAVASRLYWNAGILDCAILLRDESGAHFVAEQVARVYGSSPACLVDRDGHWRYCADRVVPMEGPVTLRFVMDFSTARGSLSRAARELFESLA